MFETILLPIDLEHAEASKKAVRTAVEMAKHSGGELWALSVVPTPSTMVTPYLPEDIKTEAIIDASSRLSKFVAEMIPDRIQASIVVRTDSVYRQILDVAAEHKVDAIVMASHHPELGDFLLGTNAAKVARHAPCSVFIVRD